MAPLLALEWNDAEARVAVASLRGNQVVVEQAFSIALAAGQAGEDGGAPAPGEQIAAELRARGIGRSDAMVAVGRASIELRQLVLPAAPPSELPEMVRLQAMREFSELDDSWGLDYMPLDDVTDGPHTVLAAVTGPQLLKEIDDVCRACGLRARHVVLRACAAAALVARTKMAGKGQLQLLVELLSDEADLTVMKDGKVLYLRTTRLPGDTPQASALLAELRRTMAAVPNQLGGRKVESVVLFGKGQAYADWARLIEEDLQTPAELFDPLAGLALGRELERSPPDRPERYAALFGLLAAELEQTGQAVDFLHPRRAAALPSRRKMYFMAGAAAVVLLLGWLVYGKIQRSWLAGEVQRLSQESQTLDAAVAKADKLQASVKEIAKWAAGDVAWLDQFRALCEDFPPAEDVLLTELVFTRAAGGGGEIRLKGLARRSDTIAVMEERLRGHSRRVVDHGSHEDGSVRPYRWRFETSVFLGRELP